MTKETIPKADPVQEIQQSYTAISMDQAKATRQSNVHVLRREKNIKKHRKSPLQAHQNLLTIQGEPTPATTSYQYTPVNYGIPSQQHPQQYPTFADYNPPITITTPMTSLSHHTATTIAPTANHTRLLTHPLHHKYKANTQPYHHHPTATNPAATTSKTRTREPTHSNNNQQPSHNLRCDTSNHRRIQQ